MYRWTLLGLGTELLLQPVFAVDVLGDDVGGGIDHCGGRIDQVAMGPSDGQGQTDLIGEEAQRRIAPAG